MKPSKITNVYQEKNKVFTENPKACKGIKVYNEKIIKLKNKEYRAWNPYRSKLGAAILKGLTFDIKPDTNILYLGAATGTTVSHFSDIINKGLVYAVESSPVSIKGLLNICEKRTNIIPILADANHPDRYSCMISSVDFIYQDISQRNQAEIFIENIKRYMKKNSYGILMVKARSIDVSLKPKKAYEKVAKELEKNNLKIKKMIDLAPYEKDHAAILVSI